MNEQYSRLVSVLVDLREELVSGISFEPAAPAIRINDLAKIGR